MRKLPLRAWLRALPSLPTSSAVPTALRGALAGLALVPGALIAAASSAPLPAEHLTVTQLGAAKPHWIWLFDESFDNEIDTRLHLYDGDARRELGQVDTGFNPGFSISPDGKTLAVGTTYFARGSHGARTDVVELTDTATLGTPREIVLAPKHAQTLPSYFNVSWSTDGHFLFAAYVTPAASFGVLDPAAGKLLGEVDTAGCVLVIPAGPNRVSSMCESGRLLTVTLDAQGKEASRSMSEPFFDPDKDPVFVQGIPLNGGFAFVSFLGEVHEVDFTGNQPAFHPVWSLVTAAERGHWRPGGQQIGAIHRTQGLLYVNMHQGGEGSHKQSGSEVWVFDLKSHRRIARWPVKSWHAGPVSALQVTQDAAPLLFVGTEEHELVIADARDGRLRHVQKRAAQSPWMLMNP